MTETEWLSSDNPIALLNHLRVGGPWVSVGTGGQQRSSLISDRKLRLLACAVWRLRGQLYGHKNNSFPECPDAGEHMADGIPHTFKPAHPTDYDFPWAPLGRDPYQAAIRMLERSPAQEPPAQVRIIHDLAGNPFRRVRLCGQGWGPSEDDCHKCNNIRTPTVLGLAERIYQDRDFALFPVLADALEDAGCSQKMLLWHLRGQDEPCLVCSATGRSLPYEINEAPHFSQKTSPCKACKGAAWFKPAPHYKGCWALDLVLVKS